MRETPSKEGKGQRDKLKMFNGQSGDEDEVRQTLRAQIKGHIHCLKFCDLNASLTLPYPQLCKQQV